MKYRLSTTFGLKIIGICLLFFTMQETVWAQDSLVAYSDTLSVLEDAADDTLWNSVPSQTFVQDFWDDTDVEGPFDFTFHIFKYGGILLAILSIIIFLLPLIIIALVVYLIYRQNQKRKWKDTVVTPYRQAAPEDAETQNILRKQAAIRQGCWGVGMILVEWIASLTFWLYVAGVILLCSAAANWLNAQLHKK